MTIHQKFKNLCANRKSFIYENRKQRNYDRIYEENQYSFQPRIDERSRGMDDKRFYNGPRANSRSDLLYEDAVARRSRMDNLTY